MPKLQRMVVLAVGGLWTAAAIAQTSGGIQPAPGSVGDQSFPATVARKI